MQKYYLTAVWQLFSDFYARPEKEYEAREARQLVAMLFEHYAALA